MTKMTTLKKALLLLSMGGATFALWGLPYGYDASCVSNADLVGFYQGIGDESIAAFSDATSAAINGALGATAPSDFDQVVITPVSTIWTAMWDNWIADQFPLDPA